MPRSRIATSEEIAEVVQTDLQRLLDTIRRPRARKRITEIANSLAQAWHYCQFALHISKIKPRPSKQQIEELFRFDQAKVSADAQRGPHPTVDDLRVLKNIINVAIAALTGEPPTVTVSPQDLGRFLLRLDARKIKPRKFKPEFVRAFQTREKVLDQGKLITQEQLAQQFTPEAYENNQESAIRAMGRALKRQEHDRERIKQLQESPPRSKNKRTSK